MLLRIIRKRTGLTCPVSSAQGRLDSVTYSEYRVSIRVLYPRILTHCLAFFLLALTVKGDDALNIASVFVIVYRTSDLRSL